MMSRGAPLAILTVASVGALRLVAGCGGDVASPTGDSGPREASLLDAAQEAYPYCRDRTPDQILDDPTCGGTLVTACHPAGTLDHCNCDPAPDIVVCGGTTDPCPQGTVCAPIHIQNSMTFGKKCGVENSTIGGLDGVCWPTGSPRNDW